MAIVAGLVFTSIFDFDVQTAGGATVSLAKYSGAPVTLIVNTASKCGFTGQYQGLQELAQAFGEDLQILAFPCHQFAQQEPGSDAEIQAFVKREYGVTFPVSCVRAASARAHAAARGALEWARARPSNCAPRFAHGRVAPSVRCRIVTGARQS